MLFDSIDDYNEMVELNCKHCDKKEICWYKRQAGINVETGKQRLGSVLNYNFTQINGQWRCIRKIIDNMDNYIDCSCLTEKELKK